MKIIESAVLKIVTFDNAAEAGTDLSLALTRLSISGRRWHRLELIGHDGGQTCVRDCTDVWPTVACVLWRTTHVFTSRGIVKSPLRVLEETKDLSKM